MKYLTGNLMKCLPIAVCAALAVAVALAVSPVAVQAAPLDPTIIPKYVTPLVIPPVMNDNAPGNATQDKYDIAVRQFKQQILPGGIWAALNPNIMVDLPATTVWSYGPDADPTPAVAPDPNSQFNYPAYTFETLSDVPVDVRWINDLIDPDTGKALPHLLPGAVDQTLHWANPRADACREGPARTDCTTDNPVPYTGAVPIVTHVHGAHVDPDSDGYPEAWWLPAAADVDCSSATTTTDDDYVCSGSVYTTDPAGGGTGNEGFADYSYRQDQPATTLWYHDHSLGMTRLNVYAGPAGFWLVRGGANDGGVDTLTGLPATLPAPAPVAGDTVLELNAPQAVPGTIDKRSGIREIPIVIQDRSFNDDGSLFYPDNRAFFEGLNVPGQDPQQYPGAPNLDIPFVPDSDIAPIWNPEAFFNVMVVNGVSWPTLEVAPAIYRFRLLNGCNSRFLNLAMFRVHKKKDKLTREIPFYQIGAEQGFLQNVVEILTGKATALAGDGTLPLYRTPGAFKDQALLMGLAERADVLVDFRGLKDGTVIRMVNTAPDAPFGGFPDIPADPATTGQVMQFVVRTALNGASPTDPVGATPATDPWSLQLNAEGPLPAPDVTRQVSLNEGESEELCVTADAAGNIVQAFNSLGVPVSPLSFDPILGVPCFDVNDNAIIGFPMAPKEALLGLVDFTIPGMPLGVPLKWTAENVGVAKAVATPKGTVNIWVTENPSVGAVEDWEIYNFTADAHPIHQHLVRFNVIGRAPIPGWLPVAPVMQPWEDGFKDTVIAYPGEITTIRSYFDVAGLYVWHCHIVEHEDNEMMRPYFVGP